MTVVAVAPMEDPESGARAEAAPSTDAAPSTEAVRGGRDLPWVVSTYFAEGLPYSLVHQVAAQQYLTEMNVAARFVGLTSLLHLPWNAKFLWAPLVDRTATAKRWMVGFHLASGVSALVLSVLAASAGPAWVAWALVGVGIVAATHDIAIDTFYMRSLDKARQTALSGVRIGAFRAAMLVGSGPLVALAGLTSFSVAFAVAGAVLVALAIVHALSLRADTQTASVEARADSVFASAKRFFVRPGMIAGLGLLLTYRAGDALLFAMNAKFMKSLGLDATSRGVLQTIGTAAFIAGSLAGGVVLAKVSFKRGFVPVTLLQSLAIPLYAWLAVAHPSLLTIGAVAVAEQFVAGMGTAAFMVFILRMCDGPHKAAHFALASSLMSVAVTLAGSASGFLFEAFGPAHFFLIAFAASIPGVLLSAVVPKHGGAFETRAAH